MAQLFASKPTLTEKAIFSKDLFLKAYFLDDEGQPDRTKMPDPVILKDVPGSAQLPQLNEVPGLCHSSFFWYRPKGFKVGTWVLGWDIDEVRRVKSAEMAMQEEKATRDELRMHQERRDEHLRFVADQPRAEATVLGRYAVRCNELEERRPMEQSLAFKNGGPMLTIRGPWEIPQMDDPPERSPWTYLAMADFGLVSGELVLCSDLDTLVRAPVQNPDWHFAYDDFSEDEEADEAEAAEERARIDLRSVQLIRAGEISTGHGSAEDETQMPLTYYCKWLWNSHDNVVGRQILGYGRISFRDDTFTAFGAELDLRAVSGLRILSGGKVSNSTVDHTGSERW